jgi:hypothetical protein
MIRILPPGVDPMLSALIASVLVAQAPPAKASALGKPAAKPAVQADANPAAVLPKPGDKVKVRAPNGRIDDLDGRVPAFRDEAAYREFLDAAGEKDASHIRALWHDTMEAIMNGTEVEVVDISEGLARIKFLDAVYAEKFPQPHWIPVPYFASNDGSNPELDRFPALAIRHEFADPDPGKIGSLSTGDHAPTLVAKDYFAFRDLLKSMEAKDYVGRDELIASGRVARFEDMTGVVVVKCHEIDDRDVAELRIGEGPWRDRIGWTLAKFVKIPVSSLEIALPRIIPGPTRREAARKAAPKPNRAAVLVRIARNLEKSDKRDAAIVRYRRIAREFPGTTEAKMATDRIQALGGPHR